MFPFVVRTRAPIYCQNPCAVLILETGYAVGCIVGPQLFISTEAPLYRTAMRTISALYGVFIIAQLTFYSLNKRENARRDRMAEQGVREFVKRPAASEDNETDNKDLGFRYIL